MLPGTPHPGWVGSSPAGLLSASPSPASFSQGCRSMPGELGCGEETGKGKSFFPWEPG